MLPAEALDLAVQFGLGDAVVPLEIALAQAAGNAVANQRTRFAGVALHMALGVVVGQAQLPVVVQVALQRQVEGLVVVANVAVVRLAEEGRARHCAHLAVHRRDAAVEHRLGAGQLGVQLQRGVRVELPGQRGGDDLATVIHMVAEAAVVLDRQVDARQQAAVVAQRRVAVQAGAVAVPAAGAEIEPGEGFVLRALADDIDQAAGIATPIQAGGRALEHLDALDGAGVRRAVAAAVDGEAVAVQLAGAEAAHAVVVEGQATEVVLSRYAAGEVQGTVDARTAEVLQHLAGNDFDGLRRVADIGVGAGRGGGAGGAVALDRAGGAFQVTIADRQALQLQGLFGPGGELKQQ